MHRYNIHLDHVIKLETYWYLPVSNRNDYKHLVDLVDILEDRFYKQIVTYLIRVINGLLYFLVSCWRGGLPFYTLGTLSPWLDINPLRGSFRIYHMYLAVATPLVALEDLFWIADLY